MSAGVCGFTDLTDNRSSVAVTMSGLVLTFEEFDCKGGFIGFEFSLIAISLSSVLIEVVAISLVSTTFSGSLVFGLVASVSGCLAAGLKNRLFVPNL